MRREVNIGCKITMRILSAYDMISPGNDCSIKKPHIYHKDDYVLTLEALLP